MNTHAKADPDRLNSSAIMQAVAMAMMHVGKLPKEQRGDVIIAALEAFKTSIMDDLTHRIGAGTLSDEEVVARIIDLGVSMEQIRHQRIGRFSNLCELLKPDVNIAVQFNETPETSKLH
jgi:hypothetical protein